MNEQLEKNNKRIGYKYINIYIHTNIYIYIYDKRPAYSNYKARRKIIILDCSREDIARFLNARLIVL